FHGHAQIQSETAPKAARNIRATRTVTGGRKPKRQYGARCKRPDVGGATGGRPSCASNGQTAGSSRVVSTHSQPPLFPPDSAGVPDGNRNRRSIEFEDVAARQARRA